MSKLYFQKIEELLPQVLEYGAKYTPTTAAEEFRQEYPEEFAAFMREYSEEFEFSGCGQRRGHINGFAIILDDLAAAGLVEKLAGSTTLYCKRV